MHFILYCMRRATTTTTTTRIMCYCSYDMKVGGNSSWFSIHSQRLISFHYPLCNFTHWTIILFSFWPTPDECSCPRLCLWRWTIRKFDVNVFINTCWLLTPYIFVVASKLEGVMHVKQIISMLWEQHSQVFTVLKFVQLFIIRNNYNSVWFMLIHTMFTL